MALTNNVAKRQKTEECTSCMELVLFSSDSLFKIASYLPADGLLNLALTCRRFCFAPACGDGDDSLSLIDETARRVVQHIATEQERAALPEYDEDNWLCKYNYLRLLRMPLTFDQLVGPIYYVEGNKSCVAGNGRWATAFSNNIMMAGKHYVSFEGYYETDLLLGVMRPGEAMQSAKGDPLLPGFFDHFTQRKESRQYNNSVNCCIYSAYNGYCWSHDWGEVNSDRETWDGMEALSSPCKIGMLLDLDEGTLSVYKNGSKLGVMKRGLAGHYCWVVVIGGIKVSIKRGTVPSS